MTSSDGGLDPGRVVDAADCLELISAAAGVDGREPSRAAAMVWAQVLGGGDHGYGMRWGDAYAALLEHLGTSTEWVKPAHLTAIVDRWREQWRQGHPDGAPMPLGGRTPRAAMVAGPELAAQALARAQTRPLRALPGADRAHDEHRPGAL